MGWARWWRFSHSPSFPCPMGPPRFRRAAFVGSGPAGTGRCCSWTREGSPPWRVWNDSAKPGVPRRRRGGKGTAEEGRMGARILVADDSVTIQKVVQLTFSREDFELIPARSGEEAIRKAREMRPDLMLIDLVMPDKNGYEVCRTLREDPQLKTTPIVLLAGTFETFDRGEGIKVGANDFVTKPFESQTLIGKVKQLLAGQGASAAA